MDIKSELITVVIVLVVLAVVMRIDAGKKLIMG